MNISLVISQPVLRAYLHFLFDQSDDGAFQVSSRSDFGSALCSFVRYSNKPVAAPEGATVFKLPWIKSLITAPNHYLYYSAEDARRLNDLLNVLFNIDFDRYYLAGRLADEKQKDIIMSFVISRKLTQFMADGERLKKRQYRSELSLFEDRVKKLINKAYYRNEKIKFINENMNLNVDKIIFSRI
jgi:hypothetical protein